MENSIRGGVYIAFDLLLAAIVIGFIANIATLSQRVYAKTLQDQGTMEEMKYVADMYTYDGKVVSSGDILEVATTYTTGLHYRVCLLDGAEQYPGNGTDPAYVIDLNENNEWTGPRISRLLGSDHTHTEFKAYLVHTKEAWDKMATSGLWSRGLEREDIVAEYPAGQCKFGDEDNREVYGILFVEIPESGV